MIDALRLAARAKEDERLRALVSSGISIDAIAALMKHSAAAVRNRASRLSIVVASQRRFSHFKTDPRRGFPPAGYLAGETSSLMTRNLMRPIRPKLVADPGTRITTAVTEIMAQNAQLERRIKALSMHFDAIDLVIEALGEAGSQERLLQLAKNNRQALMDASRELSENVRMLPALRNNFLDELSLAFLRGR